MKTRIITGSIIGLVVALFFGLRFISPYFFDVMIGVILVCGAGEVSKVFNRSGRYNNMTMATIFPVLLFIGTVLGIYFKLSFLYIMLGYLSLLLLFFVITFIIALSNKKAINEEKKEDETVATYAIKKSLLTLGIFVYPSVIISPIFFLNHFVELDITSLTEGNVGLFLLVMLFVTTMLTDVFAYFVGSTIKGKKLCPYISPNKTISGAIGGIMGAMVGAVITYYIFLNVGNFADIFAGFNFGIVWVLIYSFVASIISQAGDIFASWLKRTARTKDFSTIFPGHGGFMDRCDGLAFNAVFTFILFAIIF